MGLLTDATLVFLSAFVAATLLPFYSELVLLGMFSQHPDKLIFLTIAASVGNTLGSCVNWWMGVYLLHFKDRRWFPFKEKQIAIAQRQFNKYGVWTLLFAWLPVGGDALTLIAGILRVNFWLFVSLVFIGKAARYFVIYAVYIGLF